MKKFTGKAKVKVDSTWIYGGSTLDIMGYLEYRNGSGEGVYADGSRDYRLSLENTMFKTTHGSMTIIPCSDLEVIELFEEIILPLSESETLELIEMVKTISKITPSANISNETLLRHFISISKKSSELGKPDLSTLY